MRKTDIKENECGNPCDPNDESDCCGAEIGLDALTLSIIYLGRKKESLYLINSIKDKWSNHWEAYYLLGLHLFNKNERKAMQAFKKSLELEERFDNLVSAAQLAYFMGKHNYQKYLDKAEKLDPQRFKNFMKTCWTYDLN